MRNQSLGEVFNLILASNLLLANRGIGFGVEGYDRAMGCVSGVVNTEIHLSLCVKLVVLRSPLTFDLKVRQSKVNRL